MPLPIMLLVVAEVPCHLRHARRKAGSVLAPAQGCREIWERDTCGTRLRRRQETAVAADASLLSAPSKRKVSVPDASCRRWLPDRCAQSPIGAILLDPLAIPKAFRDSRSPMPVANITATPAVMNNKTQSSARIRNSVRLQLRSTTIRPPKRAFYPKFAKDRQRFCAAASNERRAPCPSRLLLHRCMLATRSWHRRSPRGLQSCPT